MKNNLQSLKTEMDRMQGEVNGKMKLNTENKIRRIHRSIKKVEGILEGKTKMASNLDMGNNRILDVPHPKIPKENKEYDIDIVTTKVLYDYMAIVDQKYMRMDRDSSLDGILNMNNHRITGLDEPTEADDAVTRK